MAVLTRLNGMLDSYILTMNRFFRHGRMRRSIEELEQAEGEAGLVRSPGRAEFRRALGFSPMDQLRFYIMLFSLLCGFVAASAWLIVNLQDGMQGDDWWAATVAVLGGVSFYFGWCGWFSAQWRYRWYPLFSLGVSALEFGVLALAANSAAG